MTCRSSSVTLPHFSLIFPAACFHFPSIWSQFIETSCSVPSTENHTREKKRNRADYRVRLRTKTIMSDTLRNYALRRASSFDNVIANRIAHKFAYRVAVQATHNIGAM